MLTAATKSQIKVWITLVKLSKDSVPYKISRSFLISVILNFKLHNVMIYKKRFVSMIWILIRFPDFNHLKNIKLILISGKENIEVQNYLNGEEKRMNIFTLKEFFLLSRKFFEKKYWGEKLWKSVNLEDSDSCFRGEKYFILWRERKNFHW